MTPLGYLALALATFAGVGLVRDTATLDLEVAIGLAVIVALLEIAQQLAHLVRVQHADALTRHGADR